MVSRRHISYQWRIFFPTVFTLWAVVLGVCAYMVYKEKQYRREMMAEQIAMVNERIVSAYNQNIDTKPFIDFAYGYFKEHPAYDEIRISIFFDGRLIKNLGDPIGLTDDEMSRSAGLTKHPEIDPEYARGSGGFFYYDVTSSPDGRMTVISALPFDSDVKNAIAPSNAVYYFFIILATALTVIVYFSTRYLGKNIRILRDFARAAEDDEVIAVPTDIPHDELGDITRSIIKFYDARIKMLQHSKQEHELALRAVEEKARIKRQLTNNINHELKTPIGVIKGYLDTIVENPDMEEASREHFMRKAREHVDRLVNLMTDVSAITRLDEGANMVVTEEFDAHDLAAGIESDLRNTDLLGAMTLETDVPQGTMVVANYNLISAMLMNLIKNAVAYSKGSRCEFRVVGQSDKDVTFSFRDDGTGVPEESVPHLFERFYRIDTGRTRKAGGTGLGLAIVQTTIHAHGGTITARNRPDRSGLEFIFTLPKTQK